MLLRKGLESAAHDVIAKLETMKEDIAGKNLVAEVATISAAPKSVN
jgi:hypothetical protein